MTRTTLLAAALFAVGCAAPALAQEAPPVMTASPAPDVTVTSHPGNSISPNYHVDFDAMDANHDGAITRAEGRGNPDLMREFHVVDANHNGRLSRDEMKGWLD
ncbi:MAG: hypothetical protein ACTHOC_10650 [Luteimonas sp.]|jgi:hypothetical protein